MKLGRLTKNKEFQLVYKRGQVFVGRFMVLYVLPGPKKETRVGFTVGKKIGGSVQRNYVRRRLKEAYRWLQPNIAPGYDIVLVARARALMTKFDDQKRELRKLLLSAKLLV